MKRHEKITALMVQSANIPIHTAIGPKWYTRTRKIHSATLHSHIVSVDTIIEKRTSPAALIPYAIINEPTHTRGLTIVIALSISMHNDAEALSIPARYVTGLLIASTNRHETNMPAHATFVSFTI